MVFYSFLRKAPAGITGILEKVGGLLMSGSR
jgi:hypothetical protein